MNAGDPLCWSPARWEISDFNVDQSDAQWKWRRQCYFFISHSFFEGCWVTCCAYKDIFLHPSELQQLLIDVQRCNRGRERAGAHARRVNQRAEITAAGSWPETPGQKTELSKRAAETLCGGHGQDVCFPSPPREGTSSHSFPS